VERLPKALSVHNKPFLQDMQELFYVADVDDLQDHDIPIHPLHGMRFAHYAETALRNCMVQHRTESRVAKASTIYQFIRSLQHTLALMWPVWHRPYGSGSARQLSMATPYFTCLLTALLTYLTVTEGECIDANKADTDFGWARDLSLCMHATPIACWSAGQVLRSWQLLAEHCAYLDPADASIEEFRWLLLVRTAVVWSVPVQAPTDFDTYTTPTAAGLRYTNDAWLQVLLRCWMHTEIPLWVWRRVVCPLVRPPAHRARLTAELCAPFGFAYSDLVATVHELVTASAETNTNDALRLRVVERVRRDLVPSYFSYNFGVTNHYVAPDDIRELEKYWHHAISLNVVSNKLPKASLQHLLTSGDYAPHYPDMSFAPTGFLCQQLLMQHDATAVPWFENCVLYDDEMIGALLPALSVEQDRWPRNNMRAWACRDPEATVPATIDETLPPEWKVPLHNGVDTPRVFRVMDRLYVYYDHAMWEVNQGTWSMALVDAFCLFLLVTHVAGAYVENNVEYNMEFVGHMVSTLMQTEDGSGGSGDDDFVVVASGM
jgi:hypothetical protein